MNRNYCLFFLMSLILPGGLYAGSPDAQRQLHVIETYGDAMGVEHGCSKREVFYYGADNQVHRKVKYTKDAATGEWSPMSYTTYVFDQKGRLTTEFSLAFGRYYFGEMAYSAPQDTISYSYDAEGRLARKQDSYSYSEYTYNDDGSVVSLHQVETGSSPAEQTITYSDFAGVDLPRHTESTGTTASRCWTLDTEYDALGNKTRTRSTKFNSYSNAYQPNELQVFVYDESHTLTSDTIYTIKVNEGVETYAYRSYTTYTPESDNPDRIVVYKRVWDTILNKFGTPKTWNVEEYTLVDGAQYSPALSVEPVEGAINTVALEVQLPSGCQSASTVLNIYRQGIEIAHEVSFSDSRYFRNGLFRYVDEKVLNGTYDYYVELGEQDASGVKWHNISNIVSYLFDVDLPKATNLHEVSRRTTSTYNSEEGVTETSVFVTIAWDEPAGKEAWEFQRYNVMTTTSSVADNEEEEGQSTTYEFAMRGIDEVDLYIQTVYTYGRTHSDTIHIVSDGSGSSDPGEDPNPSEDPDDPDPTAKDGVLYFQSPASHQVVAISENGKWACGIYSDDDSGASKGFRWNLETGVMEYLGDNNTGFQIANDGTIAGSYYTKEVGDGYHTYEVPGTWNNGRWTRLAGLNETLGAWAYGISPDAQYVVGTDGNYVSHVWKNGNLVQSLEALGSTAAYAVSPDGQYVAGWVSPDGTRNCGYWDVATGDWHHLEPGYPGQPWQAAKKFSADGHKLLYWGGYHYDPQHVERGTGIKAIYDLYTNDTTYIYPMSAAVFNFDIFDMNADASLVLGYEADSESTESAIVWRAETGECQSAEEYLVARGASFDGFNMMPNGKTHYIARALATDGKANTIAVIYYDKTYQYHSLIVAFGRETQMTPPVNVRAEQVTGLYYTHLTWNKPLGDTKTLKGYNVYRDGRKVNKSLLTETSYYDAVPGMNQYSYYVTALYDEGESAPSAGYSVVFEEREVEEVRNLSVRQRGYNDIYAVWDKPASNLTPVTYTDDRDDVTSFGGGSFSFETGTLFDSELMTLYAGHSLTAVSFYPMSEQKSWTVNVYKHTTGLLGRVRLETLGSYQVTQPLVYGQPNIFYLPTPITLTSGSDLLIGIATEVSNASYDVQGVFEGGCVEGYTDLIRRAQETSFYSINQKSSASYDVVWGVSAYLAPKGSSKSMDEIISYNVYADGAYVGRSESASYRLSNQSEGFHEVGVEAQFANGARSAINMTTLQLTANADVLTPIVPTVELSAAATEISWSAPLDNDPTVIGYCGEGLGARHPKTNSAVSEFYALTDFTADKFRSYEDYQIASLSFLPLAECGFSLSLYAGTKLVAEAVPTEIVVGQWNTVQLPEPVAIVPNVTYHYLIDIYDAPAFVTPLATDDREALSSATNLYQIPGGEDGWTSISELNVSGNWMMRLNVVDADQHPFDIDTYFIYIDDQQVADQSQENFSYSPVAGSHTVRVDAHYVVADSVVAGSPVNFGEFVALDRVEEASSVATTTYSIDGIRRSQPVSGFNVIRVSNGSIRMMILP